MVMVSEGLAVTVGGVPVLTVTEVVAVVNEPPSATSKVKVWVPDPLMVTLWLKAVLLAVPVVMLPLPLLMVKEYGGVIVPIVAVNVVVAPAQIGLGLAAKPVIVGVKADMVRL